jgi:hypothetical protein
VPPDAFSSVHEEEWKAGGVLGDGSDGGIEALLRNAENSLDAVEIADRDVDMVPFP